MKLEIAKRDLGLSISSNSITIGSGTDIFCQFIFRITKDFLQVLSSNGRAGITTSIVIPQDENREEEVFAVEAWRMKTWAEASKSDTIIFNYENNTLTLSDNLGSINLPCSSADLFPFWDDILEEVEEDSKFRVSSKLLKDAFTFVRPFVADSSESERPEIAVAESSDGVLSATNGLVLSSVFSNAIKGIDMRVHGKDFTTLLKFLSSCKNSPVDVYLSDKHLFIERDDSTLFCLAKPPIAMQKLVVPEDRDLYLTVEANTMKLAMKSLAAAISRDEDKMHLGIEDDNLVLSDGGEKNSMKIPCSIEIVNKNLPEEGFWFTFPYFQKILDLYTKEEVKIEIILRERDEQLVGGMLCVQEEGEDGRYTADLVWRV